MKLTPEARQSLDHALRDAQHLLVNDRNIQVIFGSLTALRQSLIVINALLVKQIKDNWETNNPEMVAQAINSVAEERAHQEQIPVAELTTTLLDNVLPAMDIVRKILEDSKNVLISGTDPSKPSELYTVHGTDPAEQVDQGSGEAGSVDSEEAGGAGGK